MCKIITTERGWPGHFIGSRLCLFRRNTLVQYGQVKVVVSTVGKMMRFLDSEPEKIGYNRYYETMAFLSDNSIFDDADVDKSVFLKCKCGISEPEAEIEANQMHENAVKWVSARLQEHKLPVDEFEKDRYYV